MKRYRSVGGTCFDVANTIFLVLLTIVMLYPMVNVLAISFSSKSAIDAGLVTWRPHGFNVSGYQYMLRDAELIHSYGWTIAYALGGTALTLTFTSLIAYPLSQPQFVLKKGITLILSITMLNDAASKLQKPNPYYYNGEFGEMIFWDFYTMVRKDFDNVMPVDPPRTAFEDLENEDLSINKTALDTYVKEEYIKFIMGDRPLSEYDAFLAEMANYGDIDLVEEIYNSHIVTEE